MPRSGLTVGENQVEWQEGGAFKRGQMGRSGRFVWMEGFGQGGVLGRCGWVPGRVRGALWLSARGSAGGGAARTRVSFLAVSECDTGLPHGSTAATDIPVAVRSNGW